MIERLRCSQCGKLISEDRLVKHKEHKLLEKMVASRQRDEDVITPETQGHEHEYHSAHHERLLKQRYHIRTGSSYAGGGRIGCHTFQHHCGPVEIETITDYVDQFEHFIGEKT